MMRTESPMIPSPGTAMGGHSPPPPPVDTTALDDLSVDDEDSSFDVSPTSAGGAVATGASLRGQMAHRQVRHRRGSSMGGGSDSSSARTEESFDLLLPSPSPPPPRTVNGSPPTARPLPKFVGPVPPSHRTKTSPTAGVPSAQPRCAGGSSSALAPAGSKTLVGDLSISDHEEDDADDDDEKGDSCEFSPPIRKTVSGTAAGSAESPRGTQPPSSVHQRTAAPSDPTASHRTPPMGLSGSGLPAAMSLRRQDSSASLNSSVAGGGLRHTTSVLGNAAAIRREAEEARKRRNNVRPPKPTSNGNQNGGAGRPPPAGGPKTTLSANVAALLVGEGSAKSTPLCFASSARAQQSPRGGGRGLARTGSAASLQSPLGPPKQPFRRSDSSQSLLQHSSSNISASPGALRFGGGGSGSRGATTTTSDAPESPTKARRDFGGIMKRRGGDANAVTELEATTSAPGCLPPPLTSLDPRHSEGPSPTSNCSTAGERSLRQASATHRTDDGEIVPLANEASLITPRTNINSASGGSRPPLGSGPRHGSFARRAGVAKAAQAIAETREADDQNRQQTQLPSNANRTAMVPRKPSASARVLKPRTLGRNRDEV